MSIEVITFGCRLNTAEAAVIEQQAKACNLKDVIIVNTCAVTAETERQIRQKIRTLHTKHPDKSIVVTGCSAELRPDIWQNMPQVSTVIGNQDKLKPSTYHTLGHTHATVTDDVAPILPVSYKKTRAFLAIQSGCDHQCTFCTITHARGDSYSFPLETIIAQAHTLSQDGCQEIVLTGVDLTSYHYNNISLAGVIHALIDQVPHIKRWRISSLDPAEIEGDLYDLLVNEPSIMPHIHLSIQAGNDLILKRMRRRHTRQQVLDLCHRLKKNRPTLRFGADFIVGFPTETAEMFQDTCTLVQEAGIDFLHVFGYSPRPETPAARMPQVASEQIKDRVKKLTALKMANLEALFQKDKRVHVLVEKNDKGYSEDFLPIKFLRPVPTNTLVMGQLVSYKDGIFWAKPLQT